MFGWTVRLAIDLRIIWFVLLKYVVNSREEHSGNGNNSFLVSPAVLESQITVPHFGELFGTDSAKGTLDE